MKMIILFFLLLLSIAAALFLIIEARLFHSIDTVDHEVILAAEAGTQRDLKAYADNRPSDKPGVGYIMPAADDEIGILTNILDDDDFSKSRDAAERLVNYGKRAVHVLCKKIPGASTTRKGQMIFILGRIGDKGAVPVLIDALGDDNAYIRRNAARALGSIKDNSAAEALMMSLSDKKSIVRADAASSLGEINDVSVAGSLIDAMADEDEKEEIVKTAAIDALARLKDRNATPVLLEELKKEMGLHYKNKVIRALGEIGDERALVEMIDYRDSLICELEKEETGLDQNMKYHFMEARRIADTAIEKIEKESDSRGKRESL